LLSLHESLHFAAGFALCAAGFLLANYFIFRPRRKRALILRDHDRIAFNARARIDQTTDSFVLVTGDSIATQLVLTPLSNFPVIEIAFPGLESHAFADRIAPIMSGRMPLATVLAIGSNNALRHDLADPAQRQDFLDDLARIANAVEGQATTILLSLPRISSSSVAYGSRQQAMAAFDDVLRSFAAERDWIFFDYPSALTHAAMSPDAQTASDGLHLSTAAARALAPALRKIIAGIIIGPEQKLQTASIVRN
jgi:hypothetical protein